MKNEVRYQHDKVLENEEHDDTDTGTKKVSLYALDMNDTTKKRLTGTALGDKVGLDVVSSGDFVIPPFDTQIIDESTLGTVVITYKKDNETVAVKTIVVDGTTTTISVT
jgi:hypothetical protein